MDKKIIVDKIIKKSAPSKDFEIITKEVSDRELITIVLSHENLMDEKLQDYFKNSLRTNISMVNKFLPPSNGVNATDIRFLYRLDDRIKSLSNELKELIEDRFECDIKEFTIVTVGNMNYPKPRLFLTVTPKDDINTVGVKELKNSIAEFAEDSGFPFRVVSTIEE